MNVFEPIEMKIKKILEEVAHEEEVWTTTEFTKQIKSRLCQLGKEYKYFVCASGCDSKDEGEWLYDLTWLDYEGGKDLLDVPLVMECEWLASEDDINADFQKLLLARSSHRVMIFMQRTEKQVSDKIDRFKEQIKKFTGTCADDRYLFAGYYDDNASMVHIEIFPMQG